MKKGLLYILALTGLATSLNSCIKNGTDRTVATTMDATVGNYEFNTTTVTPATIKPQLNDTSLALVVTGLDASTGNKIVLTISKYNNKAGTWGIAPGEAIADYELPGSHDLATKGSITIKEVKSNEIIGTFFFTTASGVSVSSGTFTVGRPGEY